MFQIKNEMFGAEDVLFPLDSMLSANRDDVELCDWLRDAEVGDVFQTGGAAGESTVERVS